EIEIAQLRIAEQRIEDRGVIRDGANDATDPSVRTDDRRVWMSHDEVMHLLQVRRWRPRLRERHVDVIMDEDEQSGLSRESKDAVERRIEQAGHATGDLRRHEFLMDRELTDAREDAREDREHASDVVG